MEYHGSSVNSQTWSNSQTQNIFNEEEAESPWETTQYTTKNSYINLSPFGEGEPLALCQGEHALG